MLIYFVTDRIKTGNYGLFYCLDFCCTREWVFSKATRMQYATFNILAWLWGFRVKIENFSGFFCPSIPKRVFNTKKTPHIEVWPDSVGAMLEYWYIELGLFTLKACWLPHLLPMPNGCQVVSMGLHKVWASKSCEPNCKPFQFSQNNSLVILNKTGTYLN